MPLNYTYAEATWTQGLEDWIGSHVRAMSYFGAVPEIVVRDNLKAGVTNAHRYERKLNRTYQEWGEHYGMGILPATLLMSLPNIATIHSTCSCVYFVLAKFNRREAHAKIFANRSQVSVDLASWSKKLDVRLIVSRSKATRPLCTRFALTNYLRSL